MSALLYVSALELILVLLVGLCLSRRPMLFGTVGVILLALGLDFFFEGYALGPYAQVDTAKLVGQSVMFGAVAKPGIGMGHPTYGVAFDSEIPLPSHSDKQVLLRVSSAGLNPSNYKINFGLIPFLRHFRTFVAGYDVSGTVIAIGSSPACSHLKIGSEVFGFAFGSFAQFANTYCSLVTVKPKALSFSQAASTPVAALTSLEAFERAGYTGSKAEIKHNKKLSVLVVGGSGGCGMYGLQIAKAFGFGRIVSINSKRNNDIVLKLGAGETVDYTNKKELEKFVSNNQGMFDFVYDTVSSYDSVDMNYYPILLSVLKQVTDNRKNYIQINAAPFVFASGIVDTFLNYGQSLIGIKETNRVSVQKRNFDIFFLKPNLESLEKLKGLYDEKKLKAENIILDQVFKLDGNESLWKAFAKMESRRTVGKIVFEL